MGENARPWLQHMGALRPDLPIEAMIKIKIVAVEAEMLRLDIVRFTPTQASDLKRETMNSISEAHLRSAKFAYVLNCPYCDDGARVLRSLASLA